MLRKPDSVLSAGRWRQANPVGTLYNDDKTLGTTPGQKKKKKKDLYFTFEFRII